MRLNFQLLLLFCIFSFTIHAQDDQTPTVNIGDMAPSLRVQEWIKGTSIEAFEKGKIYVVEFWATWCRPCIAGIPHLSALARKYRNKVTFIGMDIYEHSEGINIPLPQVRKFVDSMGKRMNYTVAAEDSNFMETDWMFATGTKDEGIPTAFVVDAEGRLAWIGYPMYLDTVLPKILNNTWNIEDALATRILNKNLAALDISLSYDLVKYQAGEYRDDNKLHDTDEPDSILFVINKIIQSEPRLKYAPLVAGNTFAVLLETDLNKAYEYGKVVIVTPTYEDPAYDAIINDIQNYLSRLKLSAEIYELGAEAHKLEINHYPYPKLANLPKEYHEMAAWYWLANDKSKARHAERKAVKAAKRKNNIYSSKKDWAAFKAQLKQYKRM